MEAGVRTSRISTGAGTDSAIRSSKRRTSASRPRSPFLCPGRSGGDLAVLPIRNSSRRTRRIDTVHLFRMGSRSGARLAPGIPQELHRDAATPPQARSSPPSASGRCRPTAATGTPTGRLWDSIPSACIPRRMIPTRNPFSGCTGSPASPPPCWEGNSHAGSATGSIRAAVLQNRITLAPGRGNDARVHARLRRLADHARTLIARYRTPAQVDGALAGVQSRWDALLGTTKVVDPRSGDGPDGEHLAEIPGDLRAASGDARRTTRRAGRTDSAISCRTASSGSRSIPNGQSGSSSCMRATSSATGPSTTGGIRCPKSACATRSPITFSGCRSSSTAYLQETARRCHPRRPEPFVDDPDRVPVRSLHAGNRQGAGAVQRAGPAADRRGRLE